MPPVLLASLIAAAAVTSSAPARDPAELPPPPPGMQALSIREQRMRVEAAAPALPMTGSPARLDTRRLADHFDIPIRMGPRVAAHIRHFQTGGRHGFRIWMRRSTRFLPLMQPILAEHGVPRDSVFLAMIESGFATHHDSEKGAAGPWQFIPATAAEYGLRRDHWVDERRDPLKSTEAAARFLKRLHAHLGHWHLAWAGYNTGGTRVRRLVERRQISDFWRLSRDLAPETREYVPKIIAAALIAKHPRAFGFSHHEFDYLEPLTYEEARLAVPVDLAFVARVTGTGVERLRELNPELERGSTPPASSDAPYVLRVPPGTAGRLHARLARASRAERLHSRLHRVRRGETVVGIARRYGAHPQAVRDLNRIASDRQLKAGARLVVPLPPRKAQARRAAPSKRVRPRAESGANKPSGGDRR